MTLNKDYDYVRDEMDIPRLQALNAYQEKRPPESTNTHAIRLMLESFFGVNDSAKTATADVADNDSLLDTLVKFPQGG